LHLRLQNFINPNGDCGILVPWRSSPGTGAALVYSARTLDAFDAASNV
jgi:hypothetical protein